MNLFSFLFNTAPPEAIEIFPIPIQEKDFVSIDVQNIYVRILTDVMERTQGIPKETQSLLWDNCLASEKQEGLVTLIAKAMANKEDLFVVYYRTLKLVRKADQKEVGMIRDGYKQKAEPVKLEDGGIGLYVTFKNYTKTDMVKFYSQLEYCSVGGLWKQGNISKAIQMKYHDMRAGTSLADKNDVKAQAVAHAKALKEGKDISMDAKDVVETASPDISATKTSVEFVAQKRSFYLGLPASYLLGELTGGLGDKGNADAKAVERGLKSYYFSIGKPITEGLFSISTTFKSEDSEGLSTALETLKTMDVTSDEYLSKKNKTLVVNKAFGLDDSEKGDEPPKVDPKATTPPVNDPKAQPPPQGR